MAKGKPRQAKLSQLQSGDYADFFALLSEKSRGMTGTGKPYFACKFRDSVRTVSVMVWADSSHFEDCGSQWRVGSFFKLRGVFTEHEKYGPQVEAEGIRPINDTDRQAGFDESEFRRRSRFDSASMWEDLRQLVLHEIQNGPLRKLVIDVLERHEEALKELPASPRHYYPFIGGWLEHSLSVTRTVLRLIEHYSAHFSELKPPLNRDLIVAGAVLHDIGRVREIAPSEGFEPTIDGRLFGHVFLGREVVRSVAMDHPDLDAELLQLLEHLLLSYLALPEWGSPRLPVIPEVLIVHHAVDLDAKLEMYVRCLTHDTSPGPFTERDPILGRHLFRDRKA